MSILWSPLGKGTPKDVTNLQLPIFGHPVSKSWLKPQTWQELGSTHSLEKVDHIVRFKHLEE